MKACQQRLTCCWHSFEIPLSFLWLAGSQILGDLHYD